MPPSAPNPPHSAAEPPSLPAPPAELIASIAENLAALRRRIATVCDRARRCPSTVELMAVSKVHPAEAIVAAVHAGQRLFGENRVQEFASKRDALAGLFTGDDRPRFHLIGPLQNNKTTRAAELFDAIDAVDSLKTAQRLNATAASLGKVLPILLEVKLSHEESKHGLAPSDLPALLRDLAPLENLRVSGLMTVPPLDEAPEAARPYFRTLRELRDQHRVQFPSLTELSMGMSGDFEVAIEEGSTCVRVGTAIFGGRSAPEPDPVSASA
jgi:pyridoxal phosphate enzyme (YggS family)